jgi:hemoglobin
VARRPSTAWEEAFYASVLADPLLQPLFGGGRPHHVEHLTMFTAETFGGPPRFSQELGFAHLIEVHRHLGISEEQRERFVALYMRALEESDLPQDEGVRPGGSRARRVRDAGCDAELQRATDEELHPLREVPRWTWDGDAPE